MIRQISVEEILASYNDKAPLSEASTIPGPWYVDRRIADLEALTVFTISWQVVGRVDQVTKPGQFVTATVAGEPIVAVRGSDDQFALSTTCVVTTPRKSLLSLAALHPSCTVHITGGTTVSMVRSRACLNSTA